MTSPQTLWGAAGCSVLELLRVQTNLYSAAKASGLFITPSISAARASHECRRTLQCGPPAGQNEQKCSGSVWFSSVTCSVHQRTLAALFSRFFHSVKGSRWQEELITTSLCRVCSWTRPLSPGSLCCVISFPAKTFFAVVWSRLKTKAVTC